MNMMNMANLSHGVSNAIIGLHMAAIVTYSLGVILSNIEGDKLNTSTAPIRALVLSMEFPFESNSILVLELVMIAQFFHLLLQACAINVLNALIMTLIRSKIYCEIFRWFYAKSPSSI